MRFVVLTLFYAFILCFLACDTLFYYPRKDPSKKPVPTRQRELLIESQSGNKLHTFVFEPEESKAVVLFFHGNARNVTYLYRTFYFIYESGYTYIAFDYSGYGKSEGSPSRDSLYFDGIALLEYANQISKEKNLPLIVIGQSLGGAVLAGSLKGFKDLGNIDLIHFDCTFPSYREVADYHGKKYTLLPIGSLLITDTHDPQLTYPKLKESQVLVSHCRQDKTVPYYLGEKIYSMIPSVKKEFWSFDCKHSAAFWKEPNRNKLLEYYDQISLKSKVTDNY